MAGRRIDGIDFWRGFVLACIFVNHIPGNVVGSLTPRNFGFSDASEAFVFISGLSVVLAYGRRFENGRPTAAALPVIRRAGTLYGVHLGLTMLGLTLFAIASRLSGQDTLMDELGRNTPFSDPVRGIFGIVTLGHQVGYFNILPLYVVLLGMAPVLILMGLQDRNLMLLSSAAVYAFSRLTGANMPSWPDPGDWYFNPLAWQLMFALGVYVGLGRLGAKNGPWVPVVPALYRLALVYAVVSAVIVSDVCGLVPGFVDMCGAYLDWDKTELGLVRILGFLSLAYVIYASGVTDRLRRLPFWAAFCRLGRHGLTVFCVGTLLSSLGQILNETWIRSPLFDIVYVAFGLLVLDKVASFLEWHRRDAVPLSPQASRQS